jgi:hypothetical protein
VRARRIALALPCRNFDVEDGAITDAPIQTLPAQYASLDLHHIQPTGVLWGIMKLQALKDPMRFLCRECLVHGPGRVSGKIVHHDPDLVRIRVVGVGQIAHADSKVFRGPLICHLHMAPGSMRVEKHEQIGSAITAIFIIVTLRLARLSRDRRCYPGVAASNR